MLTTIQVNISDNIVMYMYVELSMQSERLSIKYGSADVNKQLYVKLECNLCFIHFFSIFLHIEKMGDSV